MTESGLLNSFIFPNTLKATQDTVFLTLSKDQYDDILLSQKIGEKYEISNFLRKTQIFSLWSIGRIGSLFPYLSILNVNKGQIVYKINDVPMNFYIVKSGLLIEKVNFSMNYINSWPAKEGLKEKLYIKKNYLVEFNRYEIGDMFGLSELVNKNNRGSQISALKDSFLYAFPIDALNEILSEHERKQIVSYQKLESEKLRLLNKKRKKVQNTLSQSKLILKAMDVTLRPESNIFKNPDVDRRMACAKKIVYSKIQKANEELKDVKSFTVLYDKQNKIIKRCYSRDDSYLYKTGSILQ